MNSLVAEPTDALGVGGRTDFETTAIIADPVILDVISLRMCKSLPVASDNYHLRTTLTVFNAICWIGFLLLMRFWPQQPQILFQVVTATMMFLSLPLAIFAFAFTPPSTETDAVIMAIAIGANTIIWAHFVTEFLRLFHRKNLTDKQSGNNTSC